MMKIFLLFYMCHFAVGLTHCYKTTVFFTFIMIIMMLVVYCIFWLCYMHVFSFVGMQYGDWYSDRYGLVQRAGDWAWCWLAVCPSPTRSRTWLSSATWMVCFYVDTD